MGEPKYEDRAQDPGAWRDMAQIHRITADHLWEHFWLTVQDKDPPRDREKLLAFFRAYVLHAALARELASNAVLVRQNPKIVVGGKLDLPRTHDLLRLARDAFQREPTAAEKELLKRYKHAVTWFATYPVPLGGILVRLANATTAVVTTFAMQRGPSEALSSCRRRECRITLPPGRKRT